MVRIDGTSGKRVFGGWPDSHPKGGVIWEAFKAETEPKRSIRQEEIAARSPSKKSRATSSQSGQRNNNNNDGDRPAAPTPVQGASGTKRDQDFIQEQGGIY